jgi:hypothetical protein
MAHVGTTVAALRVGDRVSAQVWDGCLSFGTIRRAPGRNTVWVALDQRVEQDRLNGATDGIPLSILGCRVTRREA